MSQIIDILSEDISNNPKMENLNMEIEDDLFKSQDEPDAQQNSPENIEIQPPQEPESSISFEFVGENPIPKVLQTENDSQLVISSNDHVPLEESKVSQAEENFQLSRPQEPENLEINGSLKAWLDKLRDLPKSMFSILQQSKDGQEACSQIITVLRQSKYSQEDYAWITEGWGVKEETVAQNQNLSMISITFLNLIL